MGLTGKHVVVGIGGGIAAFKAVELVRELGRRGADVRVVMTRSGARFVGPVTFAGITGHPAIVDLWDSRYAGEVHVELSSWADAIVIAPATMSLLARAAHGLANDVVLATLACAKSPVLYAPAMHTRMWTRPVTQRSVALLTNDGASFVGPVIGPLASGEVGEGRMAEPAMIADALASILTRGGDLAGRTIVVTAGPTYEDIDPVRFLGNRSTGRMGYAIAERAAARGADVTLISGPTTLVDPRGVRTVRVRSALDMKAEVERHREGADAIVMAAAVADHRPTVVATDKQKKGDVTTLELVRNPDILAELGAWRTGARPVLVGFAVETKDLAAYARDKLTKKKCDFIVANEAKDSFGREDNRVLVVDANGEEALPVLTKSALADVLLDRVASRLSAGRSPA